MEDQQRKRARNAANATRMRERRATLTVAQLAAINADSRKIRGTQPADNADRRERRANQPDAERDADNADRREIRANQPDAEREELAEQRNMRDRERRQTETTANMTPDEIIGAILTQNTFYRMRVLSLLETLNNEIIGSQRREIAIARAPRRGARVIKTNIARALPIDEIVETNILYNAYNCGQMSSLCIHCNAYYWTKEKNSSKQYTKCCMNGANKNVPLIEKPPPIIEVLLTGKRHLRNSNK